MKRSIISIMLLALFIQACTPKKELLPKPNILFIAVDDLRTNLSCYGDSIAISPNIDKLAQEGILYDRAYCQQTVCLPSRTSVMTGLRPGTTQIYDLRTHFRKRKPNAITLSQFFKNNGYHSQCFGKIYHASKLAQDPESWSVPAKYNVYNRHTGIYLSEKNKLLLQSRPKGVSSESVSVHDTMYLDGKIARDAIEAMKIHKNKPFFMAVGFKKPHLPFNAPKKYWDLYSRDQFEPSKIKKLPTGAPEIASHNWRELKGYADIGQVDTISLKKALELKHGYYASVSYIDEQIGKLLNALDELKLKKNTIVVLWSDHGYHLGEQGLWCKTSNYELDTRVPFIIVDPRKSVKGEVCTSVVELVDLYPTLVELAGMEIPESLDGVSIASTLKSPGNKVKEYALSQFPRPPYFKKNFDYMGYSIRNEEFRYTEWINTITGKSDYHELYSYKDDEIEKVNLVNDPSYKEIADKLSSDLKSFIK